MTIYLKEDQIDEYINKYSERLQKYELSEKEIEDRVIYHLKNDVVIKYSKEWQDKIWDNLMETMAQPGGYWVLQDYCNMQHVEFEHYKQKTRRSYEKGNVSLDMAKKELDDKQFELYKILKDFKTTKTDEGSELEVDCEVTVKLL